MAPNPNTIPVNPKDLAKNVFPKFSQQLNQKSTNVEIDRSTNLLNVHPEIHLGQRKFTFHVF